jgi:hypothetical protein
MPYKGFDVNKEQETQNMIEDYKQRTLDIIYTILDKTKKQIGDSDYQDFIKELKENLGE